MDQNELQNSLVFYQMLQNQMEELKNQATQLQARMVEVESTLIALDELGKLDDGNEMLVPLGSGVFMTGKSVKGKDLIVELGAGIFADRSIAEARAATESKRKEIEALAERLQRDMTSTIMRINELGEQLQKAMEHIKK